VLVILLWTRKGHTPFSGVVALVLSRQDAGSLMSRSSLMLSLQYTGVENVYTRQTLPADP
jgi:hypothetical protein